MLNCTTVRRLLTRYMDGEIDGVTASELKAHFEGCPSCAQELSELSALKNALVKKERKSLPEDYLIYRLRERLRSEGVTSPKLQWLLDMGKLSRRLIPVPVAVIVLSLVFLSVTLREFDKVNLLDSYLFQENLGQTELNLLEESNVSLDSATRIVFGINGNGGR